MKKFNLFAALAALFIATASQAGPSVPLHWKWEDVRVRTFAAANPEPGFVDSLIFRAVSVESNASGVRDTTIAFGTATWGRPITTAADTADFCVLVVSDPPGLSSGATFDSLGVAVQVSADGANWATALVFAGGTNGSTITTGNNQAHVNGVFQEQISVNAAGVSPHMWVFKFKNEVLASNITPEHGGLASWPYIRFVFRYADGTDGVILSAKLGHWETTD